MKHAPSEIRTRTCLILSQMPLPIGLRVQNNHFLFKMSLMSSIDTGQISPLVSNFNGLM